MTEKNGLKSSRINNLETRFNVVGAAVLVFEVVGVFPDVDAVKKG